MDPKLQRRIQRYGWDLAARDYEPLWQTQLAAVQLDLLTRASPVPGDCVLDVACGTGLVAIGAARAVGPGGRVLGIDLSGQMVDAARRRREELQMANVEFSRMDAETLDLPDASFDVVLCALGLMYMPHPGQALREMRRVLRPGGRLGLAVWGERSACGWSALFPIIDAEVASDVCPMFFSLGQNDALARICADAGFDAVEHCRITATLVYADANAACDAALVGGPVALAWSRFSTEARARVRARYLEAIARWRDREGYRVPGEFVVVAASVRSGRGAAAGAIS
jgi:ubiquinone/menaquinone biosynthesis C-methylase UbiE